MIVIAPDLTPLSLGLKAIKPLQHASLTGIFGGKTHAAKSFTKRSLRNAGKDLHVPLYKVEDQSPGAVANGPAVLEEAFFTCRIDAGWSFEINDAGDIRLGKSSNDEKQDRS